MSPPFLWTTGRARTPAIKPPGRRRYFLARYFWTTTLRSLPGT